MIEDVLNCLINNNLIEIHEQWETINNNIQTRYFILDKVNDEYKKNITSTQKESNEVIKVSIPEETIEEEADKTITQQSSMTYSDLWAKMRKEEEKRKEIENQKIKEQIALAHSYNEELKNSPEWQKLLNWQYK